MQANEIGWKVKVTLVDFRGEGALSVTTSLNEIHDLVSGGFFIRNGFLTNDSRAF